MLQNNDMTTLTQTDICYTLNGIVVRVVVDISSEWVLGPKRSLLVLAVASEDDELDEFVGSDNPMTPMTPMAPMAPMAPMNQ